MSVEPGERRRRRELERAREAAASLTAVHGPVPVDGVPRQVSRAPGGDDPPPSRRELRERERLRTSGTIPDQRSALSTPGDGAPPTVRAVDVVPVRPPRYTWKHSLALAVVACVLGFLVWTLTTSTSGSGAPRAGTAHPTMSPSAPPAALRGEL